MISACGISIDLDDTAFLFDVDGTLLDLAPTPREVWVPPELREALSRLWRQTDGAVAFVSGRPLEELDLIFAPLQFAGVGGHGAEYRQNGADTIIQLVDELDPDTKRRLAMIAELGRGILVEDKGYSLALHYRLSPEKGPVVQGRVQEICKSLPPGSVEILHGKAVVEVKHIGVNKATGVRRLLQHEPFAHRRPLFFGDDITDEYVFPVMSEFGGMGFSIGRKIAGTNGHFKSPAELRRWIEGLIGYRI